MQEIIGFSGVFEQPLSSIINSGRSKELRLECDKINDSPNNEVAMHGLEDEVKTTLYYPINETAARRAKEANSFSDYKQGSTTAGYRQSVDEAVKIAEKQKTRVDPSLHEKIDRLLNAYARKLAENINNRNSIDARVPSVLIAGPSNFPVRRKEKQNAARDKNMREWRDIQGLLDKIRSTGTGGISADDPNAIQKLEAKLADLERAQESMKEVNTYYRKNKTLDGCPNLTADQIAGLKADMSRNWRKEPKPYEAYALSNNNAEIHRVKGRIEELSRRSEAVYTGWQFDGGTVETNQQDNRLQIFFDSKPDADTRSELKSKGFRWSPRAGAWQRQLNDNAFSAADRIICIQPITGEKPTELQKKPRVEAARSDQQQEHPASDQKATVSGGESIAPTDELTAISDLLRKQYNAVKAADPNKMQGQAAFSTAIKHLNAIKSKIPDTQSMLTSLVTQAAQSTDLCMLKERMNTLYNEFIQHYSSVSQGTDTHQLSVKEWIDSGNQRSAGQESTPALEAKKRIVESRD